eukprot:Platyproteum_vivax@DN3986_c0_g1_i2.p1
MMYIYVVHRGIMYNFSGAYGQSTLRTFAFATGENKVVQRLDNTHFGEGVTVVGEEAVQLTWEEHIVHVYSLPDLTKQRSIDVDFVGWGVAYDNATDVLYLTVGDTQLRTLHRSNFTVESQTEVTCFGESVKYLNELEVFPPQKQLLMNIWFENVIMGVNPHTGQCESVINLEGLYDLVGYGIPHDPRNDVLNGVAWHPSLGPNRKALAPAVLN